jgi:CheY-like chemotaxis protein
MYRCSGHGPDVAAAMAMLGAKVLTVDDDPLVRDVMSDVLTTAGYEVITASSGLEAICTAQNGGIDFILMDHNMPNMTGLEAARRLQADPRTRNIPVAIITGGLTGAEEQAVHRAGCVALLRKPISMERLYKLVAETIRPEP